jgi:hypothetical protein
MNLIFIFLFTFIKYKNAFLIFNKKIEQKQKYFLMKTCFPEEDPPKKKYLDKDIQTKIQTKIYTIFWHDCHESKILFEDIKKININYEYYFKYDLDKPFFYKNDDYIGNDIFDFYNEIYSQ